MEVSVSTGRARPTNARRLDVHVRGITSVGAAAAINPLRKDQLMLNGLCLVEALTAADSHVFRQLFNLTYKYHMTEKPQLLSLCVCIV